MVQSERRSGGAVRWLGLVLFVGTGFFYAAAGLVAPLWGIILLWVVWICLAILLARWWRDQAWKVVSVPFLAAVCWAAVIGLGEWLFDWTA